MDFSDALSELKCGKSIRIKSWPKFDRLYINTSICSGRELIIYKTPYLEHGWVSLSSELLSDDWEIFEMDTEIQNIFMCKESMYYE